MTTHEPQHVAARQPLPFVLRSLPIALVVGVLLTWQIHLRAGDERVICDTGEPCTLGSGGSWLLTGVALLGPVVALLGFMWSRRLHHRARLGPFSYRAIPDSEQILEVLGVLAAGLATFWLLRNGPSIEAVSVEQLDRPNTWLLDGRDLVADEPIDNMIPSRFTWFLIGATLSAPFAFSLGSMIAREWYGRLRRRAQTKADDPAGDNDGDDVIDLTVIDLSAIERQEHIDDT